MALWTCSLYCKKPATSSSESDDDIPLVAFVGLNEDSNILASAAESLNSSAFLNEYLDDGDKTSDSPNNVISLENVPSRTEAIQHAQKLAAQIHVNQSSENDTSDDTSDYDTAKDPDFHPPASVDDDIAASVPQDFAMEGDVQHPVNAELIPANGSIESTKRELVKAARLRGESYFSEKSNRYFSDRSTIKERCYSRHCGRNCYGCQ